MSIEIRPLTFADGELFASLFDHLDFAHAREWKGCYCRFYQTDCTFDQWIKHTGEENRKAATDAILAGGMHGYLAIEDKRCVGWVNAADATLYPRLQSDLVNLLDHKKVALTICFVIDPDHRNQGLARRLLRAAIDGFRSQGYDCILGMPIARPMSDEKRYRGTMNMYLEAGYREVLRNDPVVFMRLDLR